MNGWDGNGVTLSCVCVGTSDAAAPPHSAVLPANARGTNYRSVS